MLLLRAVLLGPLVSRALGLPLRAVQLAVEPLLQGAAQIPPIKALLHGCRQPGVRKILELVIKGCLSPIRTPITKTVIHRRIPVDVLLGLLLLLRARSLTLRRKKEKGREIRSALIRALTVNSKTTAQISDLNVQKLTDLNPSQILRRVLQNSLSELLVNV